MFIRQLFKEFKISCFKAKMAIKEIQSMLLVKRLKHVNYNFLYSTMQKQFLTGLRFRNSLTNQLEQFEPRDGKTVRWYSCGPTVYSNSHMGHARNYICNDMIRRVMRDYFGYNIIYAMNITDVEDKIINRSNEQGIEYFEFAKRWENDFFADMKQLGVENPNYLTRVTEYVPDIVKFIEKIIENGFAYPAKGSVYFDIKQYQTKFKYGKLKRIKDAQTEEAEVNELGKKNKDDFALWKAVKPGEPFWSSPWGDGRPGWHIECSAMIREVLGTKIDIHSGGVDLIFPHHENQISQSEAYNDEADWVKYFIHVGHLHIKGLKMSKSLKNFITIKQLLKIAPARVIKLYFFLHRYDVNINYDPETSLQEASQKDKRYKAFFGTLGAVIREETISPPQKFNAEDTQFQESLNKAEAKIYQSFCDDINTPGVIKQVDQAIKKTNIYIESKTRKITLLEKASSVISKAFQVMGLEYSATAVASNEGNIINAVTKFRDEIRQNAKTDFKKLYEICDKFRDYDLVDLNIRLEDKKIGEPSIWKYESKEILIKERQDKIKEKLKAQQQVKQREEQKLKKMSINPKDMFINDPRYSEFDENGVPTHEKKKEKKKGNGQEKDEQVFVSKPINDKLRKKLEKQWNEQKGMYEKWLALQKDNS